MTYDVICLMVASPRSWALFWTAGSRKSFTPGVLISINIHCLPVVKNLYIIDGVLRFRHKILRIGTLACASCRPFYMLVKVKWHNSLLWRPL